MGPCRLFVSQESLDQWLTEGRASVEGDELNDRKTAQRFRLVTAVRFLAEVAGVPDEANLVGRVKDVDQLAQLKAEHLHDSVILGENAYSVQVGFVGTPILQDVPAEAPRPRARAATIASLQAFFLNNVK